MTVLRAHAHSIRAHAHNVGQRLSRVLIVAVMAALAVAMFASPSRAADQTWSDVSTTINGLIDEGVSTFKAGDAKGGKDKVNDAYYKHYEITGMEKQVMAFFRRENSISTCETREPEMRLMTCFSMPVIS